MCATPAAYGQRNYRGRRFFFKGKILTITHNQLVVRGLDKEKKVKTINFKLLDDVEFKCPRESLREGETVKVDYDYTLESEVYKACVVSQVGGKPKAGETRKRKKPSS